MDLFNLFQAAIGIWLLYYAAVGRGKLFENEYLKAPRKRYVKVMRLLCLFTGAVMLLASVLEYFAIAPLGTPLSWVLWGLTLAGCIGLIAYNLHSTDRAKAKAAASGQRVPTRDNPDPLRAAFVFDEEDTNKRDERKEREHEENQ